MIDSINQLCRNDRNTKRLSCFNKRSKCIAFLGILLSIPCLKRINRNKELRSIINFNKEGKWLVLLENQIGTELPWALIKQSEAKDIIFLEG